MATVPRPVRRRSAVEDVSDRWIGAEFEQRLNGLGSAGLCSEMEGGDTLAVVGAAKGSLPVDVGAELDQATGRHDVPVASSPGERRAAVRVGVDVGAELDEPLDRLDAAALRGPNERLVEDL